MITSAIPPTLQFSSLPAINFALQQNHVPVVRQLILTNTSAANWQQVTVSIAPEPAFALEWKQTFEVLKKDESFECTNISLKISSQYLAELTEKVSGYFTITVTAGYEQVYREDYPVEILAYDQWNGAGLLPEILAAFITPNHPQIPVIIRKAAAILEKWTGSPSFDEYQSRNPNRVRKQMAAIYEAIAELQLIYCSVPASFEESGQRVRLADAIFANRLANCLDLSLLYAACLEAVGIHPIIVIIKGHAFAGAWLIDESFADAVNDDPSLITKRTAEGINEIVVVEATSMNAGYQVNFDDAVRAADRHMLKTEEFALFIDVKRTRFSGIRPLPLRIATADGWKVEETEIRERDKLLPQDIYTGTKLVYADKITVTKQRLWERKLLDLTLRNSLLNVRITKSIIQFMTTNVAALEDALANGEEFQVLARPSDWDNPLRDTGLYQALHHSDPVADLVKHELSHKRIRSYLPEIDLQLSLINIYRSSRLSLEENGANTLYIGMGLLKWYETAASERPRYAPLLLIPVEIIRKSALKGFVIRNREEETIMNITLLEMIRQDFGINIGGLETPPKDENGVDVRAVFNIIRQAIMSQPRWDVEEQAILGTFSFSKFILWNDIHHNADELCKNKVVASLMSGKLEWEAGENASVQDILDGQLHPADIALPISTDSSQLQAIVSSGQNKSFVLHGPPGTGKSQTITNIIANALYAGKRVLFVASKKAALDVVEKRLESIGIGAFCLELHSNKSKKSAVLEQLKAATVAAKKLPSAIYRQEADRLFALRNELNIYVQNLHREYPFGYSLFSLFTKYSQLPKADDVVFFRTEVFDTLTPLQLTAWQDLVAEIQTVAPLIGAPSVHPLNKLHVTAYSTQLKLEAKQQLEGLLSQLAQLDKLNKTAGNILKLQDTVNQQQQEEVQVQVSRLLLSLPDIPASLLEADNPEQSLAQLTGIAEHGKKRDALRSELLLLFQKDILGYPALQTLTAWNIASQKWFLPRLIKQNSLLKGLKLLSHTGTLKKQEVPGWLQQVVAYQQEQAIIDKASGLPALLGFLWQNGDADWDKIVFVSDTLIKLNRLIITLKGTAQVKAWRNQFALEFAEGSNAFIELNRQTLENYVAAYEQLISTTKSLRDLLEIDFESIFKTAANWNETLSENARRWLQNLDQLKDWYNWINVKDRGMQAGLQPLVNAFENGAVAADEITWQYQKGLYRSAAEYIIAGNPQLSTFNSSIFAEKISRFREISKQYETLTRQELYARLVAKIPSFTQEASHSSEIGILQKNIRNNGRGLTIRKLFDQIPNLLPRLTPCMLMSPISVAQYFEADSAKFDLVIFDEASQMPTCEAISAIARGTNVIVVGDPKQMPPTSFFSSNNVDEDNIEKEDLESILDDCLALSMPSQYLLWHYRSKHESLIAFSNANYYDNKLLTFPSTDDIQSKVTFVPVEGFYDKGKTRQNRFEAKAIVDEVVYRLSDPQLSQKSIGIVTFSSVQQILIEDLLNEVFVTRPDLEKIALECEEAIFIKNLENVQGDERDVILFSVGYGPDEAGKVSLNFGPINREGGWRRLNVAVSRARYEMKVFSTLRADQINLNRTGSEGVAGLKAFLAYAEKGKAVLPVNLRGKKQDDAAFEEIIAAEIRKHGYEVHTHIGCSDYKIDITIIDRENPSGYILGVLTDGKNYFNATTSKDREIVQVEVLAMLGWKIHKIWSTEWWEHPARVLQGILEAIRRAEENRQQPTPALPAPPTVVQKEESINAAPLNSGSAAMDSETVVNISAAVTYNVTYLPLVGTAFAEDFFAYNNTATIKKQINDVMQTEAPISRNLLCRRVLAAWGISRLGSRINNHFDLIFSQLGLMPAKSGKNSFLWRKDQQPEKYSNYRVAKNEAEKRDADDLPPEEVAIAVNEILSNQISLAQVDLIRETAKVFGYARIGSNVEMAMLSGIEKAVETGHINRQGSRLVYAK
jgi:hypothetical protein